MTLGGIAFTKSQSQPNKTQNETKRGILQAADVGGGLLHKRVFDSWAHCMEGENPCCGNGSAKEVIFQSGVVNLKCCIYKQHHISL